MSDTHGAPAPAAPAPAPAAPSSITEPGGPSAADIMAFDPFGPTDEGGPALSPEAPAPTPGTSGTPADAPKPGQPTPGAPVPPTPGTPATPATPAPVTPQVDPALRSLFEQQTAAIAAAVAPRPAEQPPAGPQAPKYNLALPPQILTALRSEDPTEFAGGMHAVINGIVNKVWNDVNEHLASQFAPQMQQMVQHVVRSQQTTEKVATDFYGKHKTLDLPLMRPVVQQVGAMIAQRRAAQGKSIEWSGELADEIAEEVYLNFPNLRPAAAPQAPAAPGGHQPKKQPAAFGGGARPAIPAGKEDEFGADLIE